MNGDVPATPGSFMRLLTRKHGMADIPKTEALFSHFAAHPIAPLFSVPEAFDSGDLGHIILRISASRHKLGGAEGIRTPDLLRAREALSQLSYSPTW